MNPVPEPAFVQAERRSYLVPIIIALVAIALAAAIAISLFPARRIDNQLIRNDVLPTHTVYKAQSMVVGINQAQDILFIAPTIKLTNGYKVPVYLDGFDLKFINADGAELAPRALTKDELANAELSFPALKPLVTTPLLRDTTIDPGQTAQGTLVFSLAVPKAMWDTRKSATIKVDVYHQYPVIQEIPKDGK